jgi:hypothetical protein
MGKPSLYLAINIYRRRERAMKSREVRIGRYVEFNHNGLRLGRVIRIKGSFVTAVLHPYKVRGPWTGKKVRVHKDRLTGIVYRKKIVSLRASS